MWGRLRNPGLCSQCWAPGSLTVSCDMTYTSEIHLVQRILAADFRFFSTDQAGQTRSCDLREEPLLQHLVCGGHSYHLSNSAATPWYPRCHHTSTVPSCLASRSLPRQSRPRAMKADKPCNTLVPQETYLPCRLSACCSKS